MSDPNNKSSSRNASIHMTRQRHMDRVCENSLPREVIRGESFSTPFNKPPFFLAEPFLPRKETLGNAAITDWLNCTFPLQDSTLEIDGFISGLVPFVGDSFMPFYELGHGLNGWHRSFKLGNSGGRFAIGGQNGTAFLSLSGEACTLIKISQWPSLVHYLSKQYNARITRWDGAVDDYEGIHSVDLALKMYNFGEFNAGGNKPTMKQHGNFVEPDGTGRTIYIGKRANGKLLRIYEKGKQLGNTESPWVRWELELHNQDRIIPWDVLINPGQYVAGSYKCMSWVHSKANRIQTVKNTAQIGYEKLTDCARSAYGKLINVMLEQEGSAEKVIEKLIRDGIPKRLEIPCPPELKELK